MAEVYDIYHDESKEGGYWHGFLLVPRKTRPLLLDLLKSARNITNYAHEVHYIRLGARTKPHYETAVIIQAWTSIGVAALQQQKLQKFPPKLFLGRGKRNTENARYHVLSELLGCKLVIFRERDSHEKMYLGMSKLQCIETTFRMGLKGGVYLLFDESHPMMVGDVFIDGDEQYLGEFGRTFDIERTLTRLAVETKSYVSFAGSPRIIPQRSDHRKIENGQKPEDSHLLQLCDILIGGVRFHAQSPDQGHVRYSVSLPCRELLSHEQDNVARMEQSRYHRGFSLSEAWLDAGEWHFSVLRPGDERTKAGEQPSFLGLASSGGNTSTDTQ